MKSDSVVTFSPSICHEEMGLCAMIFIFLNTDATIYVYVQVFFLGGSGLAVPQIGSLKRWLI